MGGGRGECVQAHDPLLESTPVRPSVPQSRCCVSQMTIRTQSARRNCQNGGEYGGEWKTNKLKTIEERRRGRILSSMIIR
eukprot:scaffold244618_cov52-Attheya_sp.AAC.2